jgi:hypothetical protein
VAVACAPDGDCPEPATTIPQHPANLPSEDEAKKIASQLLQRAGIDIDNATTAVDDFVTQWSVRVDPRLDGVATEGMTTVVTIGENGVVDYANGILGRAEAADEYPLIGTGAAIDRLNKGEGFVGPQPLAAAAEDVVTANGQDSSVGSAEPGSVAPGEPVPYPGCVTTIPSTVPCAPVPDEPPPVSDTVPPPPPPQEVTITGAEQILLFAASYTGAESWLVPAYRFTTDQGTGPSVLAIDDSFLTPPDEIPVDSGSGSGSASDDPAGTVTIEPAPATELAPAPATAPVRQPETGG